MTSIYTRPLRVYVLLGALALWGILSGLRLPISLFPSSSQARVSVFAYYGSLSPTPFFEIYGRSLESKLQGLKIGTYGVQHLEADYGDSSVQYVVDFEWGADVEEARRETEAAVNANFAGAEDPVRKSLSVGAYRENQGFFAVSFYSPMRTLDELYRTLNPIVTSLQAKVPDADGLGLFNPSRKEITILAQPEKLARYEVTTSQIQRAVLDATTGLGGGSLKIGDYQYPIEVLRSASKFADLGMIPVPRLDKSPVVLKDIASISLAPAKESQQIFKTSGVESLILFANPKEGGNLKRMSETLIEELEKSRPQWPKDVEYRVMVNPAEFIDKSVEGVAREVFLAAGLAVVVLFLFIGSIKNVVTAAIEIPLSLFMAFILMRLTGMNLNLISLGGLALSAGMNVDASVVVLENIVRHFEERHGKPMSSAERIQLVVKAVEEVRLPVIASTVASLVVFFPLVFTQGLTQALLGDLAKAVLFSHGLSAIVALVLVPTIRLHLMQRGVTFETHSPFEGVLRRIEDFYRRTLTAFLRSLKARTIVFSGIVVLLPVLIFFVVPRLKKEVIGRPESDWVMIGVWSQLFTTPKEIESEIDRVEQEIMATDGDKIRYTFTQIQGSRNGYTMIRLKNRKDLDEFQKSLESRYKNTATKGYWVEPWNPSELRIPDPPDFRVEISGGEPLDRQHVAQEMNVELNDRGIFERIRTNPSTRQMKGVIVERSALSAATSTVMANGDISHLLRTATDGMYLQSVYEGADEFQVHLRFPEGTSDSLEKLRAIPVGFEGRLIPLGALAAIRTEEKPPRLYRENQRAMFYLTGRVDKEHLNEAEARKTSAREVLEEVKSRRTPGPNQPVINEVAPDVELRQALSQLEVAVAVSIALVFLTMVLQLGDILQSLLVLIAIPLGFIGVVLSLWVFRSSLSLNSGLGTILLNGIAVANSIILVDFIRKLHERGHDAFEATVDACVARLRPILMTSLTTVLGMLPIALGLGEGGRILQPLGIAVCGGLWVSMSLTLYVVPALQYLSLRRRKKA